MTRNWAAGLVDSGRSMPSRTGRASTGTMSPEMLATPATPAGAKGSAVTGVAGTTRSTLR